MNIKKIESVKLKNISLYSEKEDQFDYYGYFLSVLYEVETEHQIKEIIIPKIDLGLKSCYLPELESKHFGSVYSNTHRIMLSNGDTLPLLNKTVNYTDSNGSNVEANEAYWVENIKLEKPRKMTLEEIEKTLGYKIEII